MVNIKEFQTVVEDTSASAAQIERFCKLSGYQKSDILGSNKNGTFVTSNGGKYVMDKAGKKLKVSSGPAYPNLEPAEEEDE